MQKYIKPNYEIDYFPEQTKEISVLYECIQYYYYKKFCGKFLLLCDKYQLYLSNKPKLSSLSLSELSDDAKIKLHSFLIDILSFFLLHYNNPDFFSEKIIYNINLVKSLFSKETPKKAKKILEKIFKIMMKKKVKYRLYVQKKYNKYNEYFTKNAKYYIKYKNNDSNLDKFEYTETVTIYFKTRKSKINKYLFQITLTKTIFYSLIKKYNKTNFQDYTHVDIKDKKTIEVMFVLYTRYLSFNNGNNQSSILPNFKMLIKTYLNIKFELFGSAINTSNNYCSLFYDIEKYYGSIGDFMKINIHKGYYEVNPPYDNNFINIIFKRIFTFFENSEIKKTPLLFLFILPHRNLFEFDNYFKIKKYIKLIRFFKKEEFPFIRFNRTLSHTVISPITNILMLLCYNNYIDDIIKENCKNLNTIINNNFIKKK